MDTLVTGLTSLDVQTLPTYRPNLITPDDLPALEAAGVVGDLALHLIVEPGDDSTPPQEVSQPVAEINNLIVGASPADFVRLASTTRTGETNGLGVMVIAVGPRKARILTAAIRMGAVNELVTDLETALAIGRHVGLSLSVKPRVSGGRE